MVNVSIKLLYAIFAIGLLESCSSSDDASSPGGVTAGEAKALDEAAEMVETKQLPPEALPPTPAAPSAAEGKGNVDR